jgi:hypothetical protein
MSAPHIHRAPERTQPWTELSARPSRSIPLSTPPSTDAIGRRPPHRDPALARLRTDLSQRSPGQALLVRESARQSSADPAREEGRRGRRRDDGTADHRHARATRGAMPYLPPTKGSGPLTPEELRRSSRQAPQPAHTGPDADRNIAVSVPLPGISSGGSYVHPALGMELDLDSRRRGLRFSGSTHAASRDEAAKITRTVSRSAWISTKASFENNGESHMKATP